MKMISVFLEIGNFVKMEKIMNLSKKTLGNLRLCYFLIVMLSFSSLIHAQAGNTIYLWPDEVPGEKEAKHAPVQTDNTTSNVIRLTNVTNPSLMIFEPVK